MSTEVVSPATVPVETTATEATPVVNGEKKPELKADKRKSTFPFAFGKKSEETNKDGEASTSPDAKEKGNPFSKFRATIKVSLHHSTTRRLAVTKCSIGQEQGCREERGEAR